MSEYFLCLDAETFGEQIRPALAASWRRRSFDPCRSLCSALLPAALDYTRRYHTGDEETFLAHVVRGASFDRASWRLLVGEVLLFAAVEIPELQTNAETLCCLLAPGQYRGETILREQFAPIQQVLRGSRDVTFGSAIYRPEQAGYNDADDVARLAAYLAAARPEEWTIEHLQDLRDIAEDERADELAFVQEWFPVLVELYQRTQARRRVLVIENIY
ncbi:MAG TPA: hypothetical protein VH643_18125 [Gemmataceae bacterium]